MSATTMNGHADSKTEEEKKAQARLIQLTLDLKNAKAEKFHGDTLIGEKVVDKSFSARFWNGFEDIKRVFTPEHLPTVLKVAGKALAGGGLDLKAGASLVAALASDSNRRTALIQSQVKTKYERMLHPPLTYLGDAFQYRTADGKFNNVLVPHLGQAGAPYAKTVPSKTCPLGAQPAPGDLFDRLLAREPSGRESKSGLSSMLIYHATIIIHDIFRTNDNDKNISDSSSYLDLSPLYGYTEDMQRAVRDDKYKLGLLKPDTFAEDRLLRQPPGVCTILVMYNRYHNYVSTQLRRINENGRFSVPKKFAGPQLCCVARQFVPKERQNGGFKRLCKDFEKEWKAWNAKGCPEKDGNYEDSLNQLQDLLDDCSVKAEDRKAFEAEYDAAWNKLDDDLFNTARLITCGMYIQVSIHDYLRALMGFHQWKTDFTLEPRDANAHQNVSRGLGNQVTVEFNLLYRFHCAISLKDERYTEEFLKEIHTIANAKRPEDIPGDHAKSTWNPKDMTIESYLEMMQKLGEKQRAKDEEEARKKGESVPKVKKPEPWKEEFGLKLNPEKHFKRNKITNMFNDQQLVDTLIEAMDDPISNFGPQNIPQCMKAIEEMGILQARKWEVGTLNDFREFFGMERHQTFESISGNEEVQDALRDLYEHPDKVELYPGVFCESDADKGDDPGPSDVASALWAAIFSDAITLVRSDRFYTVDWNTNSLTSWGMKEVTPDLEICKTSMFHRLIQRAFPEWFPYNSIRFFHPFYTGQTNARFAHEQGFGKEFGMKKIGDYYDISASNPRKPPKPVYLTRPDEIARVLKDDDDVFVHPVRNELTSLPKEIREVLEPGQANKPSPKGSQDEAYIHTDNSEMEKYFSDLVREIVKREAVLMHKNKGTYSIDITRDLAIPVTTRYVSDFLGIGHLIKTDKNMMGKYSENELYQHITNCQVFLSYNADETKLMKRRKAFKASLAFLLKLTKSGNVLEANRTFVGRAFLGRKPANPMVKLGLKTAQEVILHERDAGKAAAILLLTALDIAYDCVLAFSAVLDQLIEGLYSLKEDSHYNPLKDPVDWLTIQKKAMKNDADSHQDITNLINKIQLQCVRLPIVRVATQPRTIKVNGRMKEVEAGEVIICDMHTASKDDGDEMDEFLSHTSSFTQKYAKYRPKGIADMSLTAMIKTVAQLRTLRRGHHTQGKLKKVKIDQSSEGWTNFMAPMRVARIKEQVEAAEKDPKPPIHQHYTLSAHEIYTKEVLKPESTTYLSPTWDEMLPFPNTWKLRFDGWGESNYGEHFEHLNVPHLPDDFPPFYQKQGASHTGGTFADTACICNLPGVQCKCKPISAPEKPKEKPKDDDSDGHSHYEYEHVEYHDAHYHHYHRHETYLAGCGIGREAY